MQTATYSLALNDIPADLFADPDGEWTYESLALAAGFDPEAQPPPVVAALSEPWCGHPEGAAVVAGVTDGASTVTIIECDARAVHAA